MTPLFVFVGVAVVLFTAGRLWQTWQRGRLAKRHMDALHVLGKMAERQHGGTGNGGAGRDDAEAATDVFTVRPAATVVPPQHNVRLLRGQEPSPRPRPAPAPAPSARGGRDRPATAPAFVFDDLGAEGEPRGGSPAFGQTLRPAVSAGAASVPPTPAPEQWPGPASVPPSPAPEQWPEPATPATSEQWPEPASVPPTAPAWPDPAAAPPMVFDDYLLSAAEDPALPGSPGPAPDRRWEWPVVSRRRVAAAAAALAAIVSVAAYAAASSGGGNHRVVSSTGARSATTTSLRPTPAGGSATSPASSSSAPAPTSSSSPSTDRTATTAPTTTLPVAPPTTPGPPPVLTSLSPSSGPSGQTVILRGAGIFSASRVIIVTFGGSPAPVACRTQTACTVTVPDLGRSKHTRILLVTIRTDSGTSNSLAFKYS